MRGILFEGEAKLAWLSEKRLHLRTVWNKATEAIQKRIGKAVTMDVRQVGVSQQSVPAAIKRAISVADYEPSVACRFQEPRAKCICKLGTSVVEVVSDMGTDDEI